MLGSDLVRLSQNHFETTALDLPDFDITNYCQLKDVLKGNPIIVNCAAYTDVDGAEAEPTLAYKVNAEAVGRLGELAKKAGAWVLHISTDFVFDGKLDRPYVETDKPNPINTYGKTKLAGERMLLESGCSCCIMRIEWTYGRGGKNFVTKLLNSAKKYKELKVVDDQIGSPTATVQVAEVICELLRKKPLGLFHFASDGYVSRYEMAKFILDKLAIDVELSACKSTEFVSPAARPLNSRFDCGKIKALLGRAIEAWQGPLERFLRHL